MTQLNFTLEYEFLVGLFSEGQEKHRGGGSSRRDFDNPSNAGKA